MATIEKRISSTGEITYRVQIRKKGSPEIYKTFYNKEDANLFIFYKERLIENMRNFDVPLKEIITLESLFEMKSKCFLEGQEREGREILNSYFRIKESLERLGKTIIFYNDITYDLWVEIAKDLINQDVYRGAKTDAGKRKMSFSTLKNILARASSSVSFAISNGINLENHPLKVIQCYIKDLI